MTNKRRASNYRLDGNNPLAYMGVNPTVPPGFYIYQRDPTSSDVKNFRIGDMWLNTFGDPNVPPPSVSRLWMLLSTTQGVATWHQFAGIGGGDVTQMTADGPVIILPAAGNINIFGAHNINTSASAGSTVTIRTNNTITLGDLADVGADNPSITLTSGDIDLNGVDGSTRGIAKITFAPAAALQPTNDIFFWLNNVFIGQGAGNQTMTPAMALFNIGIGPFSCSSITVGTQNVGVGNATLQSLTTGDNNVMMGYVTGSLITTGGHNTGIGSGVFSDGVGGVTTGSFNTGIGKLAGSNYTGAESSNILIGANVLGTVGESNKLRIGAGTGVGNGQVNECFISGISGVDVGSVSSVVSITGDKLGTTTITAGAGISVTPGANTITIAATGMGSFAWNEETGTSANMAVNNGYIANNAGLVTLTLPATAAVGDVVRVAGKGVGGWLIAQNGGQQIIWDSVASTTVGMTGSLSSTDQYDTVEILCTVADTTWTVLSSKGNITVT